MKPAAGIGAIANPPPRDERAALRALARQLEGVFMNQLFQAMRQSVHEASPDPPSEGEAMFASLLDDALAAEAAARMRRGLGDALYRQLARRLPEAGPPSAAEIVGTSDPSGGRAATRAAVAGASDPPTGHAAPRGATFVTDHRGLHADPE